MGELSTKQFFYENLDLLRVDESSITPKYLQLVEILLSDIKNGIFKIGEQIPSISETSCEFYMARNTVEKAYKILREKGIITSIKGKGYYVCGTGDMCTKRILFLLNNFGNEKKQIYNSFLKSLKNKCEVDLYLYNGQAEILEKCVMNSIGHYDHYVLLPHVENSTKGLLDAIGLIPREKLLFLQKNIFSGDRRVSGILQDGKMDLYHALCSVQSDLKKYKHMNLIFPDKSYHNDIKEGFSAYCKENNIQCDFYFSAENVNVQKGNMFLILNEDELACIIKKCEEKNFVLGNDVGIVSYNDSLIKEILKGGITIFTPDYIKMGQSLANYVLDNKSGLEENTFKVIKRLSL